MFEGSADVNFLENETPIIGQQVLVWDKPYKAWVLAYWTRDRRFEEYVRIVEGKWWSPLPAAIE